MEHSYHAHSVTGLNLTSIELNSVGVHFAGDKCNTKCCIFNPQKKVVCINCGKNGHEFKTCGDPITSLGIIDIKILGNNGENSLFIEQFSKKKNSCVIISKKYPNIKYSISSSIIIDDTNTYNINNLSIPFNSEEDLNKFCYYKDKIIFLMVSRKFSIGFIEFIRGKYNVSDTRGIINLFEQMTQEEIKYIHKHEYDDILYYFLNRNNESKEIVLDKIYNGKYSMEYCASKMKFSMLRNSGFNNLEFTHLQKDEPPDLRKSSVSSGEPPDLRKSSGLTLDSLELGEHCNADEPPDINDMIWGLDFYTTVIKPKWKQPEWGFPKGRRDSKNEENLTCACREFEEETGYNKNNYVVLGKINPIEEQLVGTNNVKYKHVYNMAIDLTECDTLDSLKNYVLQNKLEFDKYEIGEIGWFTYDEAMYHIRPYHTEKKKILTKVYLFIINYLINCKHL